MVRTVVLSVRRQPLTEKARARPQTNIFVKHSVTGAGYLHVLRLPPASNNPPTLHAHSPITDAT